MSTTPPVGSSSGAGKGFLTPPILNPLSKDRVHRAAESARSASSAEYGQSPQLERLPRTGNRSRFSTLPTQAPGEGLFLTPRYTKDDLKVGDVARARGLSTPRPLSEAKPFPIADFQKVLNLSDVNVKRVLKILQDHGWTKEDLNFIQTKIRLLSENGEVKKETLIDAIISMAILKSDEAIFPAFPQINDVKRANYLALAATNVFCEKGGDLAFNIFLYVLKKFRPENRAVCVSIAFETAKKDPLLKQRLITAFPDDFSAPKGGGDEDEKEIMCKLAPPVRPFRFEDFQRALQNVEFDSLSAILKKHGWEESDFDLLEPCMNELRSQRIAHPNDFNECVPALMNLDEIVRRLLEAAIDNKRATPFFDLLPPFTGNFGSAEMHANRLGEKITSALCDEPENPLLYDLFTRIMMKFQPQNLHLFLSRVLPKLDTGKKAELNRTFLMLD